MVDRKPCARCDQPTPTIDNIIDVTSWAGIQMKTETETATRRSVRIFTADIYGRGPKGGARNLMADEEKPLCHECSYLLVGRFMQGRSVDALPGKGVKTTERESDAETIEHVAHAIKEAHRPWGAAELPAWEDDSEAWRETYRDFARAALLAARSVERA